MTDPQLGWSQAQGSDDRRAVVWDPGVRHTTQYPHDHDVPPRDHLRARVHIAEHHQIGFGIDALPRPQGTLNEQGVVTRERRLFRQCFASRRYWCGCCRCINGRWWERRGGCQIAVPYTGPNLTNGETMPGENLADALEML